MPIESSRRPLTVAVVGATGLVGRTMIEILAERDFPVAELRPLASRADGRTVDFGGRSWPVGESPRRRPSRASTSPSSRPAAAPPRSSPPRPRSAVRSWSTTPAQWRMEPGVPAGRGRVNDEDAAEHEGIIANPNCSTMQLMPLFKALRDSVGMERVIVDTYQAVSGSGNKAVVELEDQVRAHVAGRSHGGVGVSAPDRLQRAAAHRRLPRERLHQGRVEGRHRDPQDPAPAGPAGLLHRGARPRVHVRTRRRSTSSSPAR